MKAISGRPVKALQIGSTVKCADNSGAKIMQIISVKNYKGVWRTRPPAGVADWVNCKVLSGTEKVRHQVHKCIVIRQKKEYRRPDGRRVSFEDNAVVLINEKGEPMGTLIKGPMAKEAAERFPVVAKIASMVI
jgi:large subunit ribosomal protein L14